MTPEQIEELKLSLQQTVKVTVNGKIDNIHKILESQNDTMNLFHSNVESYIEKDTEWKKEADPYIKGLASVSTTVKIIVWLAVGIAAIFAASGNIAGHFK